jgi:hypothetical protein
MADNGGVRLRSIKRESYRRNPKKGCPHEITDRVFLEQRESEPHEPYVGES